MPASEIASILSKRSNIRPQSLLSQPKLIPGDDGLWPKGKNVSMKSTSTVAEELSVTGATILQSFIWKAHATMKIPIGT